MKDKKLVWHFQQFLIKHKAYKAFIDNVEVNDNPFRGMYGVKSLKTLFNESSPENWVGYGFEWSKTKEGYEFWRKLHFQWKTTVDDLNKS
jgi:hypothetical protein